MAGGNGTAAAERCTPIGALAEAAARAHLESHGLHCVAANFRSRRGELDLVMREADELVVVEVRYRANERFGGAAASVTARKQARILAATGWLLARHPGLAGLRIRFDVVTVAGEPGRFAVRWLRDAFRA